MSSEPQHDTDGEAGENEAEQLCVNCLAPNLPSAHFCVKCGAPLSSYASTGPLEHVFAEGHVYRQAVDKPRSFIVVAGIWLIFGGLAAAGCAMLITGRGLAAYFPGAFFVTVSLLMIWRTTRSYFRRQRPAAVDPVR